MSDENNKLEFTKEEKRRTLLIFGGIGLGLLFLLSWCTRDNLTDGQRRRYEQCMEEKRLLGVGWVERNRICSYWKGVP